MMGMIYMATNTVNGKRYIGQTKMTLEARKAAHYWKGNLSPFGLAIKKHGKAAFTWEVLHNGILDPEELDRLEYEEIKKRNTISPHGYNIREGGNGTPIGVIGANARRAQKVICVETGVVYQSTKEAGRKVNNRNSNIINVLSNPFRTCAGYHWRYADDAKHKEISEGHIREREHRILVVEENKKAAKKKRIEAREKRKKDPEHQRVRHENYRQAAIKRAALRTAKIRQSKEWQEREARRKLYAIKAKPKKVICLDNGSIFQSVCSVARFMNVNQSTASEAINKKRRIKGKRFLFFEDVSA